MDVILQGQKLPAAPEAALPTIWIVARGLGASPRWCADERALYVDPPLAGRVVVLTAVAEHEALWRSLQRRLAAAGATVPEAAAASGGDVVLRVDVQPGTGQDDTRLRVRYRGGLSRAPRRLAELLAHALQGASGMTVAVRKQGCALGRRSEVTISGAYDPDHVTPEALAGALVEGLSAFYRRRGPVGPGLTDGLPSLDGPASAPLPADAVPSTTPVEVVAPPEQPEPLHPPAPRLRSNRGSRLRRMVTATEPLFVWRQEVDGTVHVVNRTASGEKLSVAASPPARAVAPAVQRTVRQPAGARPVVQTVARGPVGPGPRYPFRSYRYRS